MEAAWISTIDGFCLRVLQLARRRRRARPGAHGARPRRAAAAARARLGGGARRRCSARPGRRPRRRRIEIVDRFGYDTLRGLVAGLYDELRSRGHDAPGAARPGRPVPGRRAAPARARRARRPADRLRRRRSPPPSASGAGSTTPTSRSPRATCCASRPEIAAGYAERLQRVMVDEFQDTNRLQVELLDALGQEHRFLVGDRLQAIYGFRHADVRGFDREWDGLRARGAARAAWRATSARRPRSSTRSTRRSGRSSATTRRSSPGGRPTAGRGPRRRAADDRRRRLARRCPADDPLAVALAAGMPPSARRSPVQAEARLVAQRARGAARRRAARPATS